MGDELQNPADYEVDADESLLYGDDAGYLAQRQQVQQLVADALKQAVQDVVELGIPEFVTVDKTIAQGEAGAQAGVNDISGDFPDLIADGNWRLEGVVAISDSNASADVTATIAGLLPGVSLAIKAARTIVIGAQSTFTPLYLTIRAGDKPGQFGGITATVSGGAAGDKMYLSFVFRKVRDVRVNGL